MKAFNKNGHTVQIDEINVNSVTHSEASNAPISNKLRSKLNKCDSEIRNRLKTSQQKRRVKSKDLTRSQDYRNYFQYYGVGLNNSNRFSTDRANLRRLTVNSK